MNPGFAADYEKGKRGVALVLPLVKSWADWGIVYDTLRFDQSEVWQKSMGDLVYGKDEKLVGVEVKTEDWYTSNLFAETYSNARPGRYENHGWFHTLTGATTYINLFLDKMILFHMNLPKLRSWLYEENRINEYTLKPAGKSVTGEQKNLTLGHLVKYKDILAAQVDCVCCRLVEKQWVPVTDVSTVGNLL